MFTLQGRVAMVTGAGSPRGLGRSIALAMAGQGASVVVCDMDSEGAAAVAEEIRSIGGTALALEVNVTSSEQIQQAVQTTLEKFGKIDILVNNAGITQPVKVLDTSEADWDRLLSVNLKGTFLFSKAVLPTMLKNGYGRIINMSSVSGKRGGGVFGGAHYSAAKAGILGFSKALAREVAPAVTVNSIAPGMAATDIRGALESPEEEQKMSVDIPCKRFAKPEEIAATACFLASEEAGYITGEDIDINGGSHMD